AGGMIARFDMVEGRTPVSSMDTYAGCRPGHCRACRRMAAVSTGSASGRPTGKIGRRFPRRFRAFNLFTPSPGVKISKSLMWHCRLWFSRATSFWVGAMMFHLTAGTGLYRIRLNIAERAASPPTLVRAGRVSDRAEQAVRRITRCEAFDPGLYDLAARVYD